MVFESEATGQVPLPDRSVFFLFPGLWHRYRPLRDVGWTERWPSFNGELAHRLMDMSLLQRDTPISQVADPARLISSFDNLIQTGIVNHNPKPFPLAKCRGDSMSAGRLASSPIRGVD
jgi:hypothetical protein